MLLFPRRPTAKAFTSTWGGEGPPHACDDPMVNWYIRCHFSPFSVSSAGNNSRHLTRLFFVGGTVQSRDKAGTHLYTPEARPPLSQSGWGGKGDPRHEFLPSGQKQREAKERKIGTPPETGSRGWKCNYSPHGSSWPSHAPASDPQSAEYKRSALKQNGSLASQK